MMSGNYFRLVSLLVFILVYVLSLLPIQFKEVTRPINPLRRMSYFILAILSIGLITLVPSTLYQVFKIQGTDSASLRAFTTYTATIGGIANMILLWLIFHYKMKD